MKKYISPIALVLLGILLSLVTVREQGWSSNILYQTLLQLGIVYCCIGMFLVVYLRWSKTPRLTYRITAILGGIALTVLHLVRISSDTIGVWNSVETVEYMWAAWIPGITVFSNVFGGYNYPITIAVLLFVVAGISTNRIHTSTNFSAGHAGVLLLFVVLPPYISYAEDVAAQAAHPGGDGWSAGVVLIGYLFLFIGGIIAGLPLALVTSRVDSQIVDLIT